MFHGYLWHYALWLFLAQFSMSHILINQPILIVMLNKMAMTLSGRCLSSRIITLLLHPGLPHLSSDSCPLLAMTFSSSS